MTQTSDPQRTVPTRRVSFEASLQNLPKHFAVDGDLILSHLTAAMSAVFPDGEDFFVRSVRHYRSEITDPVLKRQVAGFIGQETMHGREHRALNNRLSELGYPTKFFERLTKRGLALRTRYAPPVANLAATAALEHFTATLAELLLTNAEVRGEFDHTDLESMYLWHALEESEHKAVAFDVYKAVGGSERVRVWTMKALRVGFVLGMGLQVLISMAGDRAAYKRGAVRKSWRHFKTSPMMSPEVWQQLCDYDRRDFHPNDHDTTSLVDEWREELFGANGSLNDKLAANAAA